MQNNRFNQRGKYSNAVPRFNEIWQSQTRPNSSFAQNNHNFPAFHDGLTSMYGGVINEYNQNFQPNPRPNLQNSRQNYFQQTANGNFQYPRFHQRHKRPHVNTSHSNYSANFPGPSTPSETSPAPKRQFFKQNSVEKIQEKLARKEKKLQKLQNVENNKKEWQEQFEAMLSTLKQCKPGEEVNTILSLQPKRAEWLKIKDQITMDLRKLLMPLGVEAVMIFGSTLTGLDFEGSDLDFYVRLTSPPSNEEEAKTTIQRAANIVRQQMKAQNQQAFRIIASIQHARVPIIRLQHTQTKITCDINFTSPFGYSNSRFICQILNTDIRIRELAVILKMWSRANMVAEKMIMSNYCLVMLLLFYLQNLEVPMLDSIKNNQMNKNPVILNQKIRWNTFFNDKINLSHRNKQTTRQLLVGFFEFYSKVNFSNYVVSPYNGELILRKDFENHPDFENYRTIVAESKLAPLKYDSPHMLIVIDGFELNLNVGTKCKKHTNLFTNLIKHSYMKCLELQLQPMSVLLTKLFTEISGVSEKNNLSVLNRGKRKFMLTVHSNAGDLKLCQDILKEKDKEKIYSETDIQAYYFNHVYEGTKRFLEEVYLCFVTPAPNHQPGIMRMEAKVVLHVDTFQNRKKMNLSSYDHCYENEINISKKMSERKVPIDFDVTLSFTSSDKGKTVDFLFEDNVNIPTTKKSALLNFGNFFSCNIAQALKYYLKKEWEGAMKKISEN